MTSTKRDVMKCSPPPAPKGNTQVDHTNHIIPSGAQKGMSLHIGVNGLDPVHFPGMLTSLQGCENDARTMAQIAKTGGFSVANPLLGAAATSTAVVDGISTAASQLNDGDTFLITFAGHGGFVRNPRTPAEGGSDQTWVLYDRQMLDDELYHLWTIFKPGVRVVVVSDSCYSGSVTAFQSNQLPALARERLADVQALPPTRGRALPDDVVRSTASANASLYAGIKARTESARTVSVAASVLLLAACQDWEEADDGGKNGLFTSKIAEVWNGGKFAGSYEDLWERVHMLVTRVNPDQHPQWFPVGVPNGAFWHSTAFKV
jgi:hypothetical protein